MQEVSTVTPEIKIYTLSTCVYCKRFKKFLKTNGFDFKYVDVDTLTGSEREDVLQEVMMLNPGISFPTAVINGKVIVGFNETEVMRALGL
ncbi:MAG: glutaredoxin family protein [Methanosarcinales archaeon]|nr:glutaredoxin family protein [Methanosarcinales archaeon]